jgi:GDSL-like Lipase/Acylhydrolase family
MWPRVVLVLVSISLAILAAEALARLFNIGSEFTRLIPLQGVPTRVVDGVVLWSDAQPRASVEDVRRVAHNARAFKILGLGDSVMYGVSQPPEQTYLEQAHRILAGRSTRPVEILNLAVPGYNTVQENAVYKEIENEIQPDLVLVHYWADDNHQYRVAGGHVIDAGDISEDGHFVIRALPLPPTVSDFLLVHSRLYDLLTHAVIALHGSDAEPFADWTSVSTPLQEIQQRAQRAGGRMVILASPRFNAPSPQSPSDLAVLQEFASAHGIELIDLTEWLGDVETKQVAIDACCHFNAEGHRRIGERLADYLLQHDLKDADGGNPS